MVRSLSSVFSFVALVALTATTFAQCCDTTDCCDNGSRFGGRVFSGRVATWRANRTSARCATPVSTCDNGCNTACNTGCNTRCNTGLLRNRSACCNTGCGTMVASAPCSNMTYTSYTPATSDCAGCGSATSCCGSCNSCCNDNSCCSTGRTRSFRVFNRRNDCCNTGCNSCGTVTGCAGCAGTPTAAAVPAAAAESNPPAPAEDK